MAEPLDPCPTCGRGTPHTITINVAPTPSAAAARGIVAAVIDHMRGEKGEDRG